MEIDHTHNGTDLNNPSQVAHLSHSHVEMHPDFNHTLRFGENSVNHVQDIVPSDEDYNFRCRHLINSYTLKAPLGQNVELHKDYYFVPHMAILPFNSERIKEAPKTGDDVPEDADTVIQGLNKHIAKILPSFDSPIVTDGLALFRYLFLAKTFFSRGSLLNYLGYSPSRVTFTLNVDFAAGSLTTSGEIDNVIDNFFSNISSHSPRIQIETNGLIKGFPPVLNWNNNSDTNSFYSLRDCVNFIFAHISDIVDITLWTDGQIMQGFYCKHDLYKFIDDDPFNFERLCAYAIVQAHYYTNDNVDYVYNAEMFRNYISALLVAFIDINSDTFSWNGLSLPYDYLSGHFFSRVFDDCDGDPEIFISSSPAYLALFAYIQCLFQFRNSLRFVDYFTGARTRPLAVGEEGVAVNDGFVSAVDMAREMQRTRYLNAVNRSGRNTEDYNRGIFGVTPGYDYHNPMWLGSTSDVIYSSDVENTGSAQYDNEYSVTSTFKSNADKYAFTFKSAVYGTLIGIEYVDIKRSYTDTRDRSFFRQNRYDGFIPQMQFIGDQPIYKKELGMEVSIDDAGGTFGYTTRDMQYKCAVSRSVGGFDGQLPGWAFSMNPQTMNVRSFEFFEISPDFIRARPAEFDIFYQKLLYYSDSSYFHFIVFQTSDINVDRPMIMNPQILG